MCYNIQCFGKIFQISGGYIMADTSNIEDFMKTEKEKKEKPRKDDWDAFIEGDVVNFFDLHGLEKLTLEDGHGRKAKLVRKKDDGIDIETSNRRTV